MSSIKHLVVVVQENHTFDNYFGALLHGGDGLEPDVQHRPRRAARRARRRSPGGATRRSCSTTPTTAPANDRNHYHNCEIAEIERRQDGPVRHRRRDGRRPAARRRRTSPYAPARSIQPYRDLAAEQRARRSLLPAVSRARARRTTCTSRARSSSSPTTTYEPNGASAALLDAGSTQQPMDFTGTTIGDLLMQHGVRWAWYAERLQGDEGRHPQTASSARRRRRTARRRSPSYPCDYDAERRAVRLLPVDARQAGEMRDFDAEFASGPVARASCRRSRSSSRIGYKTEHPGYGVTISARRRPSSRA